MAERVLRDITIIIFRRFSESASLHEMREQHLQNHKMSGIELKRQRGMSLKSQSITPQPVSDTEKSSPTISEESPKLNWDNAALRIITFLSSRINPNVGF